MRMVKKYIAFSLCCAVACVFSRQAAAAGEQFAAIDDEDTTQHAPAAKSAPAPAATDDELPDDLRGKSAAEIAKTAK